MILFPLEYKYQVFLVRLTILSLNIAILYYNIYLILKSNNNSTIHNIKFKNVDNFTFFISKTITEEIYKKELKNNNIFKISFNCIDTHDITISNDLLKVWLKNLTTFYFEIHREKPDFLIYDVFGREHLKPKYNDSIKIAYYSENKIPDLNFADFAFGQAHIMYLDRYLKYPDFIWALEKVKKYDIQKIRNDAINDNNKKFCAAVISDNFGKGRLRFNFFNELNKYKKIDMGGRALNNIGEYVSDKIKFLSSYKFSFSMENSDGDGYVSEKIIDSFLAGTIPIYYGDYMVDEYINPKSFILIRGEKDIKQKIEYIKKIDNDDELFHKILKEKIFNENYELILEKNLHEKLMFFSNIFSQGKIKAKRVDKTFFSI